MQMSRRAAFAFWVVSTTTPSLPPHPHSSFFSLVCSNAWLFMSKQRPTEGCSVNCLYPKCGPLKPDSSQAASDVV